MKTFNVDVQTTPSINQIILNQRLKLENNKVLKSLPIQKYDLEALLAQIQRQQNLIDVLSYMLDEHKIVYNPEDICSLCIVNDECSLDKGIDNCELKVILNNQEE